jgi:hypothetical protein
MTCLKCWILITYMLCFSMAMNYTPLFSSCICIHEIYTGALRRNKTFSVQIFYLHFNREKIRKFKVTKCVISSSKSKKERQCNFQKKRNIYISAKHRKQMDIFNSVPRRKRSHGHRE